MGAGSWSTRDWSTYSSTRSYDKASTTVDDVFEAKAIDSLLDPKDVTLRESRDSVDNPNSTAIIIGLDVTGSMDRVLDSMARKGLPKLAEELYDRKVVTDPHLMFMGIGDVEARDEAPLQVTQFEADIRIAEQLSKLWLERGGGGNNYESYIFPWYFAAMHTGIDCFEKRGKKGYLFTMGDECATPYLKAEHIEKVLGYLPQQSKFTADELLTMVSRYYEVFHLIIEEGNYCRHNGEQAIKSWTNLLGQRAIRLSDHTKMGEVIVSTIQVLEGASKEEVISSWDGSTGLVVARAVEGLSTSKVGSNGLVHL